MSIVEKYIEYVKNEAVEKPEKSWNKILLGYKANKWMTRIAPNGRASYNRFLYFSTCSKLLVHFYSKICYFFIISIFFF